MPRTRKVGPTATLIETKLRPPAAASDLVGRPRLAAGLDRADSPRVVVVRAPAGYGKTSLLAQWHAALTAVGTRCGWLTLDEDDDRAPRLLLHLAAALLAGDETMRARLDALLADLQVAPTGLGPVIDRLPLPAGRFVLFLDELEHLVDEPPLALLRRLLDRLPDTASVVIASRTQPKLGLARLRLSGRVHEVDAVALRFANDEAASLFARRGRPLAPEVVASLHARTEGWAAALQLSTLAIAGRGDASSFVKTLSGSYDDIARYLAEDVLERQTAETRRFLSETSILRRLSPALCDALTGRRDGKRTLERLAAAGLFLSSLDDARTWYRYHPLFAGFLQSELATRAPRRLPLLHRRAARWHARHGLALDAVHHAMAASDFALAAGVAETAAKEMNRQGQFSTVVDWVRELPERVLDAHPALRAAASWACLFQRDFAEAERQLARVTRARSRAPLGRRVEDDVAIVAPIMAGHRDRIADTLALSEASLARLGSADPFNRGVVRDSLAYGLIAAGRFDEARDVLLQARVDHGRSGSLLGMVYTITFEGLLEAVQGRLGGAEACYREADTLASGGDPATSSHVRSVVLGYAAELLYERNELDDAAGRIERDLALAVESAVVDMVIVAYLAAARCDRARGAADDARRRLREAELTGVQRSWPRLVAAARFEAVRFAALDGSLAEARALRARISEELLAAEEHPLRPHAGETEAQEIGDLRLRVMTGEARRALPSIQAARREAQAERRLWRALRLGLVEVRALDAVGDHAPSLRLLRDLLQKFAPERFVRSFADEGKPVLRLVREVRESCDAEAAAHLDAILVAAGEAPGPAPALRAALAEPLSRREREMLDLVGEGLSNRGIAARLFVSENTVKFHLKAIFSKLGVTTRAEAAAAARRVGLS